MTENTTPDDFTPRDALAALAEARAYEAPLRQRTEGLTWVIWGLVTPAIFLTYHVGAMLSGPAWPWWANLLWVPWVVAGCLAMVAIWSTAALAAPDIEDDNSYPVAVLGSLGIAVLIIAWGAVLWRGFAFTPPATMVLAIGTIWTGMNAFGAWQPSRRGRVVGIGIGAGVLLAGLALALLEVEPGRASVVAVVATGVIPLTGGFYQVFRG